MKTIGLIGGMSWESTAHYYSIINNKVKEYLGGLHSAKIILSSVDFAEIEILQRAGDWETAGRILNVHARSLVAANADCLVLCTNTMHIISTQLCDGIEIPFLHIAEATGKKICKSSISKVGLLGTRFTMEQDFYRGYLEQKYDLKVVIPSQEQRGIVHDIIYNELCRGVVKDESRNQYQEVIAALVEQGAEGIILGCTEIGMLVSQQNCSVPIFDTTKIHAEAAVEFALKG